MFSVVDFILFCHAIVHTVIFVCPPNCSFNWREIPRQ